MILQKVQECPKRSDMKVADGRREGGHLGISGE